jgi:Lon protease-like protein
MSEQVPLFPLNTVLYPDGPLSLRIFEPRYLDMVKECTANDREFGVCLILSGEESGAPASTVRLGTTAKIVDFFTLDDGLLGIRAVGIDRFELQRTSIRDNGLMVANIQRLEPEYEQPVEDRFLVLRSVLERMLEQVGTLYPGYGEAQLTDATWLGYRLAELLPIEPHEKQRWLESEDPIGRLQWLVDTLPRFQADEPD